MHAIQVERTAHAAPGEDVFSSPLIDLYVKKEGVVSEIYEVKTGVGRQALYIAIGRLVTHAPAVGGNVAQYLVIPANEPIAEDLERAMANLRIEVCRFQLCGNGRRKTVKLI
ncbi:MAG: hypothetical protein V2I43_15980 [Parvularcula sp.]|jgi:hypothetical protein|nr:hypothetical protein [Parvularcula sp.]